MSDSGLDCELPQVAVEQPNGTAWGALVLDSKQPHINGVAISGSEGPLARISLR